MAALPTVGETFGRYRIERELGAGGMGVVFLATDTQMRRPVALKVIAGRLADNAEFLARFDREADTLARLDSPHIVTVFDHGVVGDVPFLAMQYVAGGELGTLLRDAGPLPPGRAALVCAQVAEALHAAHSAGIVHRDVKPGNVLMRDPEATEPFVYLSDFGIARADGGDHDLTRAGEIAGSWAYLAPERTRGAQAGPASDIYALGCVLFACLTGRVPYTGSDVEVAIAHAQEPIPEFTGTDPISADLNSILRRALAKEPEQRYATADEFRADLRAFVSSTPTDAHVAVPPGLPPTSEALPTAARHARTTAPQPDQPAAVPPPPPGSAQPGSRRRRWLPAALVAMLVAVLAIGGGLIATLADGDQDSSSPADPSVVEDPVFGDWDADGLGDARVARSVWRDGLVPLPGVLVGSDGDTFTDAVEDVEGLEYPIAGDVDGDGRLDLVQVQDNTEDTRVTVSQWRGTEDGLQAGPRQSFGWRTDFVFDALGDFDGDGRDDLLLTRNRTERFMIVAVALSNGETFDKPVEFAARHGRANENDHFVAGDFNGDGLDDVIAVALNRRASIGIHVRPLLSTGSKFRKSEITRVEDGRYGLADVTVADLEGDGTDELIHLITDRFGEDEYGATVSVQRLVGQDLGTPQELAEPTSGGPDYPSLEIGSADVDGDGDDDLLRLGSYDDRAETAQIEVYLAQDGELQKPQPWGEVPCTTPACEGESAYLVEGS